MQPSILFHLRMYIVITRELKAPTSTYTNVHCKWTLPSFLQDFVTLSELVPELKRRLAKSKYRCIWRETPWVIVKLYMCFCKVKFVTCLVSHMYGWWCASFPLYDCSSGKKEHMLFHRGFLWGFSSTKTTLCQYQVWFWEYATIPRYYGTKVRNICARTTSHTPAPIDCECVCHLFINCWHDLQYM